MANNQFYGSLNNTVYCRFDDFIASSYQC